MATKLEREPDLSSDHPLAPEVIEAFQRDGHAVVRGLASPAEVEHFRPVIRDAALRHSRETRPLAERDTYGKAFLQVPNLWRRDEAVARFVLARRFGKVAAELLGVEAVRLYHDQALFKEGGGGLTPFHQDQYYWPFDRDATITMWMPLVPVSAEIGSMTFASGSHRLGYLGEFAISDRSEEEFGRLIHDRGIPLTTHGAMEPGDATFHAGWTLHGAPPNPTGTLREVMTVIYFADGLRAVEPDHPARAFDLKVWLPGVKPGELAASEINPVVYSRD
ncbi:MAG TPA: phytanoyl-CoA dioxygenase family protein [Acidimicrobiales bacterium]|nr:phytanoyl-CoA dioxygenase family protein [Acidimicrobiales bacterium]